MNSEKFNEYIKKSHKYDIFLKWLLLFYIKLERAT